jgi:GH15 family glucan-1,4-alpha-glucosidase
VANVPGNPWFISTLWLAEWYIAIARTLADLERPRLLLEWCRTKALPSGVLAEQVHPYTGEPLSVSPLTWSHAAFVSAIQHYARTSAAIRGGLRDRAARSGEAIA